MPLARQALSFSLACFTASFSLVAQEGAADRTSGDHRVLLRYATFDPLLGTPEVQPGLRSGADSGLWIVQFPAAPDDQDRSKVRAAGASIYGYLPNDAYVVQMNHAVAAAVRALPAVRWVGAYEPAYRLEAALRAELGAGSVLPVRRYNMVMLDKRRDKAALEAKIVALGGKVFDRHIDGLLFTADLDGAQLLAAARLDEVLWIDRWSEPQIDMNNARIQGGANAVETAGGYAGQGVRGHVYEGCEAAHPDFTPAMTNVLSSGEPQRHGHCTVGIVFGDGVSSASARGMAPQAVGFYTNYATVTGGFSRNQVINNVVNTQQCMFTTASWGDSQTPVYNAVSADADDIVFDHRIPWTQSMSNLGNTNARPQAWAKNIISVGGVFHGNNSSAADDTWNGGGSIGPAQDGRSKPDLCAYYDNVWTSDLSSGTPNNDPSVPGTFGGYNTAADPGGQSTTSFNGTSSATPIVAGHNALAIQMYTDGIFGNPLPAAPTLANRFTNRPRAQTLKALQIACAIPYAPQPANNRREHVGWGFPNLNNMYTRRDRIVIVPENTPITQGATHRYVINVRNSETTLKVCMTYVDPAGNPAAAIDRINDLTVRVISPTGTSYWGNVGLLGAAQANVSTAGGAANTLDTVECVFLVNPAAGNWTVEVTAPTVAQDANLATPGVDATYALVVNGGILLEGSGCARYFPDSSPTGSGGNFIPLGATLPSARATIFAENNNGGISGTVFYNLTIASPLWLTGLDVNTILAAGSEVLVDVYRTPLAGSHVGLETSPGAWTPISMGRGVAAGINLPTRVNLAQPGLLAAGNYGIAVVARNFAHYYTTGTGSNQVYSDANLTITCGASTNGFFNAPVNTPRVANTTLYYRLDNQSWVNQRYQTILRTADLGSAGTITGLSFSALAANAHWNSSLLIRLSHVGAGHVMSTTFATNLPTPLTVLNATNHTVHMRLNDWTDIGFQTPFTYNGTSDVVVDIVAMGNHVSTPTSTSCHSGAVPRLFATAWTGAAPATGTLDASSGLIMRLGFNCANGEEYGFGCGPGRIDHTGNGARGTLFNYRLNNAAPASAAIIALGLSNTAPYPMSLAPFGFRNCFGWNNAAATVLYITSGAGFAQHTVSVPASSAYDGLKVFGQWYVLDGTQPGGLTATGQSRVIVGLAP